MDWSMFKELQILQILGYSLQHGFKHVLRRWRRGKHNSAKSRKELNSIASVIFTGKSQSVTYDCRHSRWRKKESSGNVLDFVSGNLKSWAIRRYLRILMRKIRMLTEKFAISGKEKPTAEQKSLDGSSKSQIFHIIEFSRKSGNFNSANR